jgi:hypothetical protein
MFLKYSFVNVRLRRQGFGMADFLILLVVGIALVSLLLPLLMATLQEKANRIRCAYNLRDLAAHAMIYAKASSPRWRIEFPRTYYDPSAPLDMSLRGGKNDHPNSHVFSIANPTDPVGANNVAASFYTLLKSTDLMTSQFVCPSAEATRAYAGQDPQAFANWPSPYQQFCSYSYSCPFPTAAAESAGWKFDPTCNASTPLAADINPGDHQGVGPATVPPGDAGNAVRPGNSPNHFFSGQNVAYCDGSVVWQTTPFCGLGGPAGSGDNIYTSGAGPGVTGGAIWAKPASATDSVLLPTAVDDASAPIAARKPGSGGPLSMTIALSLVIAAFVGFIVLIVVLARRSRSKLARESQVTRRFYEPPTGA